MKMLKLHTKILLVIALVSLDLGLTNHMQSQIDTNIVLPNSKIDMTAEPPVCVKMHNYLKFYSEKYGVPFHIAYGVAHKETRYNGPTDERYNPKRASASASYGAMQIQVPTANFIWNTSKVTKKKLLNNLEFNVETSMKLLSYLKQRYGTWALALGCYNTGKPIVNGYALSIIKSNK